MSNHFLIEWCLLLCSFTFSLKLKWAVASASFLFWVMIDVSEEKVTTVFFWLPDQSHLAMLFMQMDRVTPSFLGLLGERLTILLDGSTCPSFTKDSTIETSIPALRVRESLQTLGFQVLSSVVSETLGVSWASPLAALCLASYLARASTCSLFLYSFMAVWTSL